MLLVLLTGTVLQVLLSGKVLLAGTVLLSGTVLLVLLSGTVLLVLLSGTTTSTDVMLPSVVASSALAFLRASWMLSGESFLLPFRVSCFAIRLWFILSPILQQIGNHKLAYNKPTCRHVSYCTSSQYFQSKQTYLMADLAPGPQ